MEFKKYTSIENSYRQKVIDNLMQYYPKETYVVQEKIHGSNFAIYADASGVRYAKRTGFIDNLQNFFRADIVAEKYGNAAHKLSSILEKPVSIHGEIYGGSYPHNDVEKVAGVSKVQSGVFYSPDIDFIAFDMKVDGEYINIFEMCGLLQCVGIPHSDILRVGNLKECLKYSNEFNSMLPKRAGLPDLESNICEGVVIKSLEPKRLPNGDRLIVKNKNAKWSEKGKKGPAKARELPQHVVPFVETATSYVTANRLRNVLSKIGPVTEQKTAFGVIMKPFNLDVIEDFIKENPEFNELEKGDRKIVTSQINKCVAVLIRENLMNIIDGNF